MIKEILEAEIIKLRCRQAAVRQWVHNKDLQLESRIIDVNIINLENAIKAMEDQK